jgi:hypothetical protein
MPFASPLTSAAAARWSAAGVPRWVTKGALTAGWAAALVAAVVGSIVWDPKLCAPVNPAICGPDQGFAWWVVICLATPALLIWMPLLGCAAGVAFALADLAYDDVTSAKIGFGLQGLACAVVAVWLLRSAAAQERVVAEVSAGSRAAVPSTHPLPGTDLNGSRVIATVVLVLLGAGLIGWYAHDVRTEQSHLSVAEQVNGRVVAVDARNSTITTAFDTGASSRQVTTEVLDTMPYAQGSTTPVLLDPNDQLWSRLVAEPPDATGWESAGLLALLLAALLTGRELHTRRARQRLWTGEHPALRVWVVPDELGDALVFPDDGGPTGVVTGAPVARLPLAWGHGLVDDEGEDDWDGDKTGLTDPEHVQEAAKAVEPWDDLEWDAATQASFGRVWRGEQDPDEGGPFHIEPLEPEQAVLLGSLRDRGWALLITEKDALVPSGPLRVGHPGIPDGPHRGHRLLSRLPFGPWRHQSPDQDTPDEPSDVLLPGIPIQAMGQHRLDLPVVARTPARTRALGLLMLAAALAGAPAALLLVDLDWYERGLVIFIGGSLLLGGTGRGLQQVRLTHTHLEVAASYRIQLVPWERLHGVRRDGAILSIAWEPDMVVDVGPFDADGGIAGRPARAEQLGAVMLRQRERALAHGAAGRTIRSRPGPAWGLLAVYVALMCITLWVVIRA